MSPNQSCFNRTDVGKSFLKNSVKKKYNLVSFSAERSLYLIRHIRPMRCNFFLYIYELITWLYELSRLLLEHLEDDN